MHVTNMLLESRGKHDFYHDCEVRANCSDICEVKTLTELKGILCFEQEQTI